MTAVALMGIGAVAAIALLGLLTICVRRDGTVPRSMRPTAVALGVLAVMAGAGLFVIRIEAHYQIGPAGDLVPPEPAFCGSAVFVEFHVGPGQPGFVSEFGMQTLDPARADAACHWAAKRRLLVGATVLGSGLGLLILVMASVASDRRRDAAAPVAPNPL